MTDGEINIDGPAVALKEQAQRIFDGLVKCATDSFHELQGHGLTPAEAAAVVSLKCSVPAGIGPNSKVTYMEGPHD